MQAGDPSSGENVERCHRDRNSVTAASGRNNQRATLKVPHACKICCLKP